MNFRATQGMLKAQADGAAQARQFGRSESLRIQALGDTVDIAALYLRACNDDECCVWGHINVVGLYGLAGVA